MKIHTSILAILLIVNTTYAQEKWTSEKIMSYRNITDTELSPDGKYVAYVVRDALMEGEKSEYNSQIWIAATDGSFNVQYTRGEKSAYSPQFSPDNTQVAFLSNRGDSKTSQVYLMRLMGGEPEQITNEKTGVSSFKWSPSGDKIAVIMRDKDTEEDEKRKKEKRDVILVDQNYKYNHLYTVNLELDSPKIQRITGGEFHVTSFDWSPDGKEIAFAHAPDPTINTAFYNTDLSTVPADSGAVTLLVSQTGSDSNPHYSPDGKWIAFESHGGQIEPVGLSDIYVVPASGGKLQALPQTPDRLSSIVAWSPDSKNIMVSEYNKTSGTLYALPMKPQKSPEKVAGRISDLSPLTSSNGTSSSFSISPAGKISYVYENSDTPEEVYLADDDGNGAAVFTSINADFNPPKHGKSEIISWTSEDGMTIEGRLIYPVDYVEGNTYPLILNVHGGPNGVFRQNYTGQPSIYMAQLFAQEGYLMLQPNPRGSQGYGKEFRYANVKDWGFGDYQDLMSGVDHVIEMGLATEDQLYVMGWSYGGYMTSWVVSQTDRFRAASMGAGLPNLISMTTTTDIPIYLMAHLGYENFWENYELYEKHSAMYYFEHVVTPTQVIHGANDVRVPFSQGQEFYNGLKLKGVDTEMIVYPRTPHGPREPKFLMDVTPRILNWFSKYEN